MTGRGVDQILRHPSAPQLHEPYVKDALEYVRLAERANGPVAHPVDDRYIWGDALAELERAAPAARIVNLETAVTRSEHWEEKGINYRMHPSNIGCLAAAAVDCCALANNHVLDWGRTGLGETLATLAAAGIRAAGAGSTLAEARAPVVLAGHAARLLVYSAGSEDSGIPPTWRASGSAAGIDLLDGLSERSADGLAERICAVRRPGDLAVVSIHWGSNWGFAVPSEHIQFAHRLIDAGAADLVHGHSSHHPKAIERYRGKLVLYGCGDFINDYEGISGREAFHGELAVMYFPTLHAASGELADMELVVLRRRRLRLERASEADCAWLCAMLNAEAERFCAAFELRPLSRLATRGMPHAADASQE